MRSSKCQPLSIIGLCSSFQRTLPTLPTTGYSVALSAPIALIGCFPVSSISTSAFSRTSPTVCLSHRFLDLYVANFPLGSAGSRALFNELLNPPPELDELSLYPSPFACFLRCHCRRWWRKCQALDGVYGTTGHGHNLQVFPAPTRNKLTTGAFPSLSPVVKDYANQRLLCPPWRVK